MQDRSDMNRRDADRRDAAGGNQDRRDAGQEGCRTESMQER